MFSSVKVCVVGLLLAVAPVVESKISNSFLKAMEPVGSIRAGGGAIRKGVFSKALFSKAIHVGGRDLAENGDDEWGDFGFDITQYSAKYSGCSTVKTYSDDMASTNGATTVLAAQRFVIFRLCPSFYCNKYTVTGCTVDYGEYAIMMDDYLDAIKKYNEDKRDNFCNYCADCMAYNATDANSVACSAEADEACTGSSDLCAEDEVATAFEEFFACKGVDYESDAGKEKIYIAPHCGTDGFTITLAQYSDEQCATLVTSTALTIENVTGLPFDNEQINTYFPKECVSCAEQVSKFRLFKLQSCAVKTCISPSLIVSSFFQGNVWDNAAEDNNDNDGISEVCESLYQSSAKCNKHYYAAQEASYNVSFNLIQYIKFTHF